MIINKAQGRSLKEPDIDLRQEYCLHMWFAQKVACRRLTHMLTATRKKQM
jgi:hypothetical protein